MSGITDPAEIYFKDGIWGWAATVWEKLVSSGGRLYTALHGWDGSAWRKLPMLWGYSAIWDEDFGGVAGGAAYMAASSAIPAGEVWVLQVVSLKNATRGPTALTIYVTRASGAEVTLSYIPVLAVGIPGFVTCTCAFRQGDLVRVYMSGCAVLDVIKGGVVGYKMKIAE